jgi:hypothetical protein
MGCAYASTGFCLTMNIKVYSKLSDDFPDVAQMAATDDLVKLWEPPLSNDSGPWELFYDHIASYVARYMELATPIGIELNLEKQRILIPVDAPFPINHTRSNGITLKVVKDGLHIAAHGFPIGTDLFISAVADKKSNC